MANIIDLLFKNGAVDVKDLINKFNKVKSNRAGIEQKWQMIHDQVYPNFRDYISPVSGASSYLDNNRTDKIKNHCSVVGSEIIKVVSRINSQLTDPSVKWLNLEFIDPSYGIDGTQIAFGQFDSAKDWLYSIKTALYNLFADPESNFYPSTNTFDYDWFTIGTACREIILRKDNNQIRFNTISMQDIYIETSGYGDIDTVYRRFMLTPKQAYDLWGDSIHNNQIKLLQNQTAHTKSRLFEYIEVSKPNPLKDKIPSPNYMNCVIDIQNKHLVDVSLHHHSPYVVARYSLASNEIYGRSSVWNTMPDIKIVNRLNKRTVQSIDYATSPPMLVQDATSLMKTQITPNSFVQGLDSGGRPTIVPLQLGGDVQQTMQFYESKIRDIKNALMVSDLFLPDNPNMTASEVNLREIQASNLLRPILVRLEHEDLSKTIKRTISLLYQKGVIQQFPFEDVEDKMQLKRGTLEKIFPDIINNISIRFSGQMARMQRLQDVQNLDMIFNKTVQASQVDPDVKYRMNLGKMIAVEAGIYDVEPGIVNNDEVVQQMIESDRQAQAEAAQQQQTQAQLQNEAMSVDTMIKAREAGIEIGS